MTKFQKFNLNLDKIKRKDKKRKCKDKPNSKNLSILPIGKPLSKVIESIDSSKIDIFKLKIKYWRFLFARFTIVQRAEIILIAKLHEYDENNITSIMILYIFEFDSN